MALYTKNKLVAVIVFSFFMLLTATSVCNAQGYQDSEWLDSCQSYLPTLHTDVSQCENAYNDNDMSSLSTYGSQMYNDCYNALGKSKPYKVSYKYTQIKTTYETCIYYYGLAGYYYNHNDYQKANDYMDKGKDNLASFKKLAAGL